MMMNKVRKKINWKLLKNKKNQNFYALNKNKVSIINRKYKIVFKLVITNKTKSLQKITKIINLLK